MRYFRKKRHVLLGGQYACPNCLQGTLNCTIKGKPGNFKFVFNCKACGFNHVEKGNNREDVIDIYNKICDYIRRFDPIKPIPDQDFRVVKLLVTDVKMR